MLSIELSVERNEFNLAQRLACCIKLSVLRSVLSVVLWAWCLFFCFPLLSSNSFAIPYSNVILLFFSSLPIQSASIFYKIGLFNLSIEQLSQTISCGIIFLILQIKEFLYSFLNISDSMIGSIFYFTTGLHGVHVFFFINYIYFCIRCSTKFVVLSVLFSTLCNACWTKLSV